MFEVHVAETPDFRRIVALPVRDWERDAAEFARFATEAFRTPGGKLELYPIQGAALWEIRSRGGALVAAGVGHGKTLIALLAAAVLESTRPVMVLRASLVKKTRREWARYAEHFRIPKHIRIVSYEWLGRLAQKRWLEEYQPDLLVFDECQRVKNLKARVTRSSRDYIRGRRRAGKRLNVVALSGTIMNKSLNDFGHIIEWCLGEGSPLPLTPHERDTWAKALDADVNPLARVGAGALLSLPGAEGPTKTEAARAGFARRLRSTPGVLVTTDAAIDASLEIDEFRLDDFTTPELEAAFRRLRETMTLPDGWELVDGLEAAAAAKALSLGYFPVWDPRPPQWWLEPRAAWGRFVRAAVAKSRGAHRLDSELDVRLAYGHTEEWRAWARVKEAYKPPPRAEWVTDKVVRGVADWLGQKDRQPGGSLVWTAHVAFGRALSDVAGVPYFGPKGLDAKGRQIEVFAGDGTKPAPGPAVVSIAANYEGRNLQGWSEALVVSPFRSAEKWEQLLGREHRRGQLADTVFAHVGIGCREAGAALHGAVELAVGIQQNTGQPQKLCYADLTVDVQSDIEKRRGPRWERNR